jgi:hypothetical protein
VLLDFRGPVEYAESSDAGLYITHYSYFFWPIERGLSCLGHL